MRKTIIFGAVAALLGLAATAQASNDHAERRMNGEQTTSTDTDNRGEKAEHRMRDRDDAYEHSKEARERNEREREHRERNDRD